jgi:hypothetical protein
MSVAPERNSGKDGEIDSPAIATVPPTAVEHLPFPMAEDQTDALAADIGRAFPAWRIWRANGIWYATGPCPLPGCFCSRTLHAPDPSGLCRQLDNGERQRLAPESAP